MKLIARAPLEMIAGRDRRPGDTFDLDDKKLAQSLIDSGQAEAVDEKPKGNGGKATGNGGK